MKRQLLSLLLLPLVWGAAPATASATDEALRVYVGTYTSGDAPGIFRLRLDLSTGALTPDGEPTVAVSPSFLAFSADGRRLYAVNETGDAASDPPGGVSAFSVDPATGALTFLNRRESGGAAPCHLSLDRTGKNVLVANYWGGSVTVFPVESDGRLGPASSTVRHQGANPTPRDPGPHPHSVHVDPANRFAVVSDLGLDRLFVYGFDAAKGRLLPDPKQLALPDGTGPRHFAFHPDGTHAYAIGELNGTITALQWAATPGALAALQTSSTLPAGFKGANSSAEVVVSPDGRFLYGSNRGPDSLAIFAIDAASGRLTPVGHEPTRGQHPRNFAIDPTGRFLLVANRDSDNVVVFRIDRSTGRLSAVGDPVRVPRAVCVRFQRLPRAR